MNIKEKIRHLRNNEQNNEERDEKYINACNLILAEKVSPIDIFLNVRKINQIAEDLKSYNWKK